MKYTRRQFIVRNGKLLAASGLVVPVCGWSTDKAAWRDYRQAGWQKRPRMAIAKQGSPVANLNAALTALGGISAFVKKGEKVLIKPNMAFDRAPELAATVNPELVGEMIRLAYQAGASEVVVADTGASHKKGAALVTNGIGKAIESAGGKLVLVGGDEYRTVDFGGVIGEWPAMDLLFKADRLINMAIAKDHSLAGVTACMKNWFGIIGGKRWELHNRDMNDVVARLAQAFRPTLNVLDATRVLTANGPFGKSLADAKRLDTVAVGTDDVALDAYAATLLGRPLDRLGFLANAEKLGLGEVDYEKLKPKVIAL
jgi:uncharacterized protein (DUF362 family)